MVAQPTPKTHFEFQTITKSHSEVYNGNTVRHRIFISPDLIMIYFFLHIPFLILTIAMWFFYITALKNGLSGINKTLSEIPPKKYKKNGISDTCSICLGTLIENEDIRILKCKHLYHMQCIDSWLHKRVTCPLCRLSPEKLKIQQGP